MCVLDCVLNEMGLKNLCLNVKEMFRLRLNMTRWRGNMTRESNMTSEVAQHDKVEGQHDKQRCFASLNMTRESNMTKKKQNRYNNKALKPNLSKKGFTC